MKLIWKTTEGPVLVDGLRGGIYFEILKFISNLRLFGNLSGINLEISTTAKKQIALAQPYNRSESISSYEELKQNYEKRISPLNVTTTLTDVTKINLLNVANTINVTHLNLKV